MRGNSSLPGFRSPLIILEFGTQRLEREVVASAGLALLGSGEVFSVLSDCFGSAPPRLRFSVWMRERETKCYLDAEYCGENRQQFSSEAIWGVLEL